MSVTYTFIIPHKDIPDLLQRCLDSIPQREDVQVIVVDDNSDPEKVNFVHFPGLDRSDVECYFTKEGKGAGYARNVGLKYAKGKWLLFADADDFFHPNLIKTLDPWKNSIHDIIYFEIDSVDSDTLEPVTARYWLYPPKLEHCCEWVVPWGKMVRTELVRNHGLLFEEIRWGNDVMFSVRCSYYAGKNVDICDDILYCATVRKDSLTTEEMTEEQLMCRLALDIRCNKYIHEYHINKPYGNSFSFVGLSKRIGRRAYIKAISYYFIHELFMLKLDMLLKVIRFNIRKML